MKTERILGIVVNIVAMFFGESGLRTKRSGFTIVELLIVIVVIAILAAISVVAYRSIQVRVHNSLRLAEAQEWVKLFEIYNKLAGDYLVEDRFCLGRDFPKYGGRTVGSCWDANGVVRADENEDAMRSFEAVTGSSLPNYDRLPIVEGGVERVGPVFWGDRNQGVYRVKYFLQSTDGDASDDVCPVGTKWWSGSITYSCVIDIVPPGQ